MESLPGLRPLVCYVAALYFERNNNRENPFENYSRRDSLIPTTYADDTTLRRRSTEKHLPYVFVQASLACLPDDAAVGLLRARARSSAFKWADVKQFVRSRDSEDAARVRRKLEEAIITIVDPAAFYRSLDVRRGPRDRLPPFLSREVQTDPKFKPLRDVMTRRVGRVLLICSGAESLHALIRSPLVGDMGGGWHPDFNPEDEALLAELDPIRLAERVRDLNKISRIALQTTALIAHERDPEQRVDIAPFVAGMRYGMDSTGYNQARLENIIRRSTVYDRGHEDATEIAAKFHELARRRAAEAPLYQSGLYDEAPEGGVRVGVTADEVELQMADVAAGWASDVLQDRGALALHKTFRLILYNGLLLDAEEAEKLDTERRFHDRLIERF